MSREEIEILRQIHWLFYSMLRERDFVLRSEIERLDHMICKLEEQK